MSIYEKAYVNILMSKPDTVFCFFNFSKECMKKYEYEYGEGSWNRSTSLLKLFHINNGVTSERKQILPDGLADNWYITLCDSDVDIFVELGRVNGAGEYHRLMASNILTIPRSVPMIPPESYYMNLCEPSDSSLVILRNQQRHIIESKAEAPGSSW